MDFVKNKGLEIQPHVTFLVPERFCLGNCFRMAIKEEQDAFAIVVASFLIVRRCGLRYS
jgi:hypothetical protein